MSPKSCVVCEGAIPVAREAIYGDRIVTCSADCADENRRRLRATNARAWRQRKAGMADGDTDEDKTPAPVGDDGGG